jgi:hypothetical protein
MNINNKLARLAGICFLIIVIGYTLTWVLIYSQLISTGNATITVNNIIENQFLFRIGIVCDLIIGIATIILAWTLYVLLKPINNNIALLGMGFRFLEGFLAIVTVSLSFVSLQLLGTDIIKTTSNTEQLHDLVGVLINLHTTVATVPMVFTGLGSIIFFILLFKSNYIPKLLSGFGVVSYILILIIAIIKLLITHTTNNTLSNIELIFDFPSVIFEVIIGMWLIIKGIKEEQIK